MLLRSLAHFFVPKKCFACFENSVSMAKPSCSAEKQAAKAMPFFFPLSL